jgi:hypothetical protein
MMLFTFSLLSVHHEQEKVSKRKWRSILCKDLPARLIVLPTEIMGYLHRIKM